MIIKPKVRGFICVSAHPLGCWKNVEEQIEHAKKHRLQNGPKRVLVIGSSTGYGLSSRIAAAFGSDADTIGVFLERPSSGSRTATAGYYNNAAFEALAKKEGRLAESINGDAFSDPVKAQTTALIQKLMPGGKVDLIVYSLAAPKRTDPKTGQLYSSVIKPIGCVYENKTVDFHTGEVSNVQVEPADETEIAQTVQVMGGGDWLLWMQALCNAGVVAEHAATVAYSYIGPELTHPVYKDGTIGRAKEDMERCAKEIDKLLAGSGGKAFVSVNKALVTQASSAIPVVPLYMSILFKVMKEKGNHEGCIEQISRMMERMYNAPDFSGIPVDNAGRIRMDDWEMADDIQQKVDELWAAVTTENIGEMTDIEGYRRDFYKMFGFGLDGIDYEADVADY